MSVLRHRLRWLALLATVGCTSRQLRGRSTPSENGGTYLVIADDNGGRCGPLHVDGVPWPHAVGAPGAVRPGEHVVECGTKITIRVDSATTFRLDYWGP